jgi:hypothetical protein
VAFGGALQLLQLLQLRGEGGRHGALRCAGLARFQKGRERRAVCFGGGASVVVVPRARKETDARLNRERRGQKVRGTEK